MPYLDSLDPDIAKKIYSHVALTVDQVSRFTPEDLRREEIYQEIFLTALDPEYQSEIGEAYDLTFELERILSHDPNLVSQNPSLFQKYQDIILLLKFNSLPVRSPEEVKELLKNNLLSAFNKGIDVKEGIIILFVFHNNYDTWINYRANILSAFRENKEKLGADNILISQWLKDYEQFITSDSPRGNLEESSYISQSSRVKNLTETEKKWLLEILNIYDMLVFSGYPSVIEEEKITLGAREIPVSRKVTFPRIFPPVSTSPLGYKVTPSVPSRVFPPQSQLLKLYQGDPQKEKAISREEENIIKNIGEDIEKVGDILFEAITTHNQNKTLASFRILVSEGGLDATLGKNPRFLQTVEPLLKNQYGESVLADFRQNPVAPSYFSLFLQAVFKNLEINEGKAAVEGLRLGNILSQTTAPHYLDMVYGDLTSGEYKWTLLKQEENKLVLPSLGK